MTLTWKREAAANAAHTSHIAKLEEENEALRKQQAAARRGAGVARAPFYIHTGVHVLEAGACRRSAPIGAADEQRHVAPETHRFGVFFRRTGGTLIVMIARE